MLSAKPLSLGRPQAGRPVQNCLIRRSNLPSAPQALRLRVGQRAAGEGLGSSRIGDAQASVVSLEACRSLETVFNIAKHFVEVPLIPGSCSHPAFMGLHTGTPAGCGKQGARCDQDCKGDAYFCADTFA